jgi:hypothetical protein
MTPKIFAYIAGIILLLTLSVGVGYKLMQTTESQKAKEIDNYSFEPHFGLLGGCASYRVMQKDLDKPQLKKDNGK